MIASPKDLKNQLRRFIYSISFLRPTKPHNVGIPFYRKNSSWTLNPTLCPCDLEFVDYLKENQIRDRVVFHFGTGSHHVVGLGNQTLTPPNDVIGITASAPEHQAYVQLTLDDRELAKHYKVIFADIYTLTARSLPMLDVVTLFHLCEFYLPEEAAFIHQTDESLVQLFLDKLNPDGRILFYSKSFAWERTQPLLQRFEAQGKLEKVGEYRSLMVYAKRA